MAGSDDDLALIRSIAEGDEQALVELMERHKVAVFRFACRYLGDEADSEEVAEETFFRVYRKAATFSPRAAVKTWIFSIARNLCCDRLRKRRKFYGQVPFDAPPRDGRRAPPAAESIDSGARDPGAELRSAEALDLIQARVRELPDKLRFPFVFCVLENHSYDECADSLGVSRKTVETRIYRARQALRRRLADYFKGT